MLSFGLISPVYHVASFLSFCSVLISFTPVSIQNWNEGTRADEWSGKDHDAKWGYIWDLHGHWHGHSVLTALFTSLDSILFVQ